MTPINRRVDAPEALPELPTDHLTWRPLVAADADALHALLDASEVADQAPHRTSRDEVTEIFEGPWKNFETDAVAGVDDAGVLRAAGWAEIKPGDTRTVRAFLSGTVHPDVRGRGIGTALLAWLVARGRQMLVAEGKELPARLAVDCADGDAARQELFEKAGFTVGRYWSVVRRDLSEPLPEPPTLAHGLRVVPWSEEIDDAIRLAHNDAFRDHWGSEPSTPESWAKGRATFAPQWTFAVLDEDAPEQPHVAAYLVSGRYDHVWDVVGYSTGYTELLGVRREYRGRRLAPALLTEAMRAYQADGVEYAQLEVDTKNPSGAHDLYASLGYRQTHMSRTYTIEL